MNTIVLTDIIITHDSGIIGYATIFDTFRYENSYDLSLIDHFFEQYPRDIFLFHGICNVILFHQLYGIMLVIKYEPPIQIPESVTNMQ